MAIQFLVSIFVFFVLTRVYLRYREHAISALGLVLWSTLWLVAVVFVWWPAFSDVLARQIGVGRGVDFVVYVAIIILFYGLFRLYVKMEFIEHELTSLVRSLALDRHQRESAEQQKKAVRQE